MHAHAGDAPILQDAQRRAIREIERRGGAVSFGQFENSEMVESITLRGTQFTDEDLVLMDAFRGHQLKSLGIVNTELTDVAIAKLLEMFVCLESLTVFAMPTGDHAFGRLGEIKHLRSLTLSGTGITSAMAPKIAELKELDFLDLAETEMTDEAMIHLTELRKLKWLSLGHTKISSCGLEHFATLKKLETLLLNDTKVDDGGLQFLSHMPSLRVLRVDQTAVTDAGMQHIAKISSLESLVLGGKRITRDALGVLQQMPRLRDLDVEETRIREKELNQFLLALPANQDRWQRGRKS